LVLRQRAHAGRSARRAVPVDRRVMSSNAASGQQQPLR
jgi:hypothetical protein